MNSIKNTEKIILPSNPEETYKNEWKGWADFLGEINKWTKKEVLYFLTALEVELEFLEPIEILRIVEQSGSKRMFKNNDSFSKLLDSNPNSLERKEAINLLKQDFGGDEVENSTTSQSQSQNNSNTSDTPLSKELTEILSIDTSLLNVEELSNYNYTKELKAFDSHGVSCYTDHETIQLLIKYRLDKFWNDVMSKNYNIDVLRNENGGKYFTIIKERFLEEYDKVVNIKIPADYQFKDNNGNIAEPNLMQKLIVHRLMVHKRYGNWSSMGAGKTLSAVLAGRVADLKNTLIITFNSNIPDWVRCINNAFPDNTKIIAKEKKGLIKLDNNKFNYIIFNYETFQQENYKKAISAIITNDIHYVVLDEIQMVKQRYEDTTSQRRKNVSNIVQGIECKNRKAKRETYKLTMSATPVINNLLEPKKTLELLNNMKYDDIKTFPTVNNALNVNKHIFLNGIRFKPSYNIDIETKFIKIDGKHLIHYYLNIPKNKSLEIEKLFIPDKLMTIKNHLKPGTMIYTHYVTGIIQPTKEFIERLGFSVSVYTGLDKTGLEDFKNKECDILLCSSPIGTGVDGLQRICDQIIILTLPWTNSEYENLLGRIARQGTAFKKVTIIIPQVDLDVKEIKHSYDVNRMNIVDNKKTLSNIVLDAIIPSNLIPKPEELVKEAKDKFKKWINRIENKGLISINRESLLMCVEEGVLEVKQDNFEDLKLKLIKLENTASIENVPLIENEEVEIAKIDYKEIEKLEQKSKKIDKELSSIKLTTENNNVEPMFKKSILTKKQQDKVEEMKKVCRIPIKIDEQTTIYVDDPAKVEKIKKKYGIE